MQDATCWCGFGGVRRPCLACLLNERRRVRAAAAARARVDRCAPQWRAAAEEPQRRRRGLGRVARGAVVLRLLLLPAMLLLGLAGGAGTPVRFEEQLEIMAKEKPGRASEAGRSIEFVVTDTMRHEHTHTLEIRYSLFASAATSGHTQRPSRRWKSGFSLSRLERHLCRSNPDQQSR